MKFVICNAFVLAAVLIGTSVAMTADEMAHIQALAGECMAAEGASESELHEMMAMEIPSTPTGMCLNACMMEKTGITAGGVFSVENSQAAAKHITDNNPDKMKLILAITADCGARLAATAAADRCEYAKQVVECNTAGAAEHGYIQRELLSP